MVMNDSSNGNDSVARDRSGGAERYYKKDFWRAEHAKFLQPHFRLEKCARIINRIARGRDCDLLDVGCGPATMSQLLDQNIHYYGIDISIHRPAPNLIEADFLETPIKFNERRFDIVVAQGVFEYVEGFQSQKLAEIRDLVREDGIFIVSYTNFGHRKPQIYGAYSNVQSFDDFRESLESYFRVDRFFPASHNWHHGQPNRQFIKAIQRHLNVNIPLVSPMLAVEYFFVCSPHGSKLPTLLSERATATSSPSSLARSPHRAALTLSSRSATSHVPLRPATPGTGHSLLVRRTRPSSLRPWY